MHNGSYSVFELLHLEYERFIVHVFQLRGCVVQSHILLGVFMRPLAN